MNKILNYFYICIAFICISACKKQTVAVYDKPVEARVSEFLTSYQNVLLSAENGWKVQITPKEKATYQFWIKFDDKNRVQMVADINRESRTTVKESSYRLRALQQPMLLFDTYTYIHLLADPNRGISGSSVAGTGLQSDYQFYPDSASVRAIMNNAVKDTLTLVGQFNGIVVNFIKATAEESSLYQNNGLQSNFNAIISYFRVNPFNSIDIDGVNYELQTSLTSKQSSFYSIEGGDVTVLSKYFAYTLDGLNLQEPLKLGSKFLKSMKYDQEKKQLMAIFSDGTSTLFNGSKISILPLAKLIPNVYSVFSVPSATNYNGWSPDFVSRRARTNTNTLNSGYNLRLGGIRLNFTANGIMTLTTSVIQNTTTFLAVYTYNYRKDENDQFKFDYVSTNGNGGLIIDEMSPLLRERIDKDTFTITYYYRENGSTLAKFTSVQHSDFYFTTLF